MQEIHGKVQISTQRLTALELPLGARSCRRHFVVHDVDNKGGGSIGFVVGSVCVLYVKIDCKMEPGIG